MTFAIVFVVAVAMILGFVLYLLKVLPWKQFFRRIYRSARTPDRARTAGRKIVPPGMANLLRYRNEQDTAWRIEQLGRRPRIRYLLVGGIYLDLAVRPAPTKLDGLEYSNIEPISFECGGSARYVGKYLYEQHRVKSHIFTRLGRRDLLSRQLRRLFRREKWPRRDLSYFRMAYLGGGKERCGMSVHLVHGQAGPDQTTLTHRGALRTLSWDDALPWVSKKAQLGSILYISGFFRIALAEGFVPSLKKLPAALLIVIDHGQFVPMDLTQAADELLGAFSSRLLDVYICRRGEFESLMSEAANLRGISYKREAPLQECLADADIQKNLPPITIVRDENPTDGEPAAVHFIALGVVNKVDVPQRSQVGSSSVGRGNMFNASFMYWLHEHALLKKGSPALVVRRAIEASLGVSATKEPDTAAPVTAVDEREQENR